MRMPPEPPSSPRRPVCQGGVVPSGTTGPSASGKPRGCGAACPMAHLCARRRLADPMAGIVARLPPGSGGRTLGRAGLAPAGRQTKLHEGIASSFPFDPHCLVALFFLYSNGKPRRVLPQARDDHVGIHDVAEYRVKRGERRRVLGVRMRRVTVAHHHRLEVEHH
jgi:hypothetical protein